MKKQDFNQAIEIITEHHTNELVINHVKPNGQVSPVLGSPTIHITRCCAAVINKLVAADFTLSMDNGMLSVSKY